MKTKGELTEIEQWISISQYGSYEVSSFGRVRSLDKISNGNGRGDSKRSITGRILRPQKGIKYLTVNLYGETYKTKYIHHLVAEAFMGYTPIKGFTIDHKDNIPTNNYLNNLQIITQRENNSKDTNGKSTFTGVCWSKQMKKWKAYIKVNKKSIHLGYFDNESDAGMAYINKLQIL